MVFGNIIKIIITCFKEHVSDIEELFRPFVSISVPIMATNHVNHQLQSNVLWMDTNTAMFSFEIRYELCMHLDI